jgi:glucan-binding YG repeat protein
MRKQTKLVAVASAAALLAVGASMTSFAAAGWVEEDGQWFFYDRDGNRVEDTWKKSGDNWYWLDSEEGGAMAIDKLVEDGEETYYVDSNGVMVRNTWVKVVNEEQDDESDPAEYIYYYMQGNGKAYKTKTNSTHFKTIDGKRYAFDEDGKMLYGWVNAQHERIDSDDWWSDGVYYLGEWDDGAMKTGWQKIYVSDNLDDDEEKEFWFNFKSNGQKRAANDAKGDVGNILEKSINGKKYGFDYRGVMTYEWTLTTTNNTHVGAATASSWKYFNSPEDGARVTKGWFKVVAPEEDNDNVFTSYEEGMTFAFDDADSETERWYYADGDGELYAGKIKKIKGKYYAFRPQDGKGKDAAMLTGLVLMRADGDDIIEVLDDDVDADDLDAIISDNEYDNSGVDTRIPADATLYYFGNDEDHDGAMKTGNVTVNLDGESYNFKFSKSGGAEGKGRGITGIDDKKYVYKYGLKLKASNDDKYLVVYASGDTASSSAQVAKIDSQELRDLAKDGAFIPDGVTNKDGDSVTALAVKNQVWDHNFKLLTTSGTIVKNKTAAKDGADWYFYVDNEHIVMYSNTKTLTADSKAAAGSLSHTWLNNGLNTWKDWDDKNQVFALNVPSLDTRNDVE